MKCVMEEIAERAQKIFDETYTVADILKGNTIEMHQECWDIANHMFRRKKMIPMNYEKAWVVVEKLRDDNVVIAEFDDIDLAAEFVENKAQEDAKKDFPENTYFDEIQEEWWEAVEEAHTYYTIEERG